MLCHLCDSKAVAIYFFNEGCICAKDKVQPLCEHHIYKATPIESMEFIKDLTLNEEFTKKILSDPMKRGFI